MLENIREETPLVQFLKEELGHTPAFDAGVQLFERQLLGHINLRGESTDPKFLVATEEVLGFKLPLEANTVVGNEVITGLWLGPNEWLILTPPHSETEIIRNLKTTLGNIFSAVNDISGGQTVINLQGENVRDVLNKGCTLDLHPRVFGPGFCAQTHLAKTNALIWQRNNSPSFDIIVRRSFADYLARWIKDASQEYGIAVVSQPAN